MKKKFNNSCLIKLVEFLAPLRCFWQGTNTTNGSKDNGMLLLRVSSRLHPQIRVL